MRRTDKLWVNGCGSRDCRKSINAEDHEGGTLMVNYRSSVNQCPYLREHDAGQVEFQAGFAGLWQCVTNASLFFIIWHVLCEIAK